MISDLSQKLSRQKSVRAWKDLAGGHRNLKKIETKYVDQHGGFFDIAVPF